MTRYTVRVNKRLSRFRSCVQAHDNCLEVLPHINLYLSKRRPRVIGSPGHVILRLFLKTKIYVPKIYKKSSKKKSRGAPPPYGTAPHPPTKVGSKCLVAVVLISAHHDRVLSLVRWTKFLLFPYFSADEFRNLAVTLSLRTTHMPFLLLKRVSGVCVLLCFY